MSHGVKLIDKYPSNPFVPDFQIGRAEDVKTPNGNLLHISASVDFALVADLNGGQDTDGRPHYRFIAQVDKYDAFMMDISRRVGDNLQWAPHPDIRPKILARAALNFFDANGIPPRTLKGIWVPGSLNFKQYEEAIANGQLNDHGESKRAANQTWTAGLARELGFSTLSYVLNDNPQSIIASFARDKY